MTRAEIRRTVLELPPEERYELATALWESLEAEQLPVPQWQKDLIDERLAALEENPDPGSSWEEVKARIWPDEG